MRESILHYIWQYRLFTAHNMVTTFGDQVEVVDVGKYNTDAGPDFFNAKIKIGETLWAGNVEIHTRSTDWNRHSHDADKAYDSVILHVVSENDGDVYRVDGDIIPQLVLTYPSHIEKNYDQLISDQKWVSCQDSISNVPSIIISSWKNALLTERLEQKMQVITNLLMENNQHWEEAFYITLARNFGFGTNSQAFEMLAKSIPLHALGKHKDQLFQLEAILFGQAGLLDVEMPDEYCESLQQEYRFLQAKFNLQPMTASQWKLLRLRPDNFPHVRIAQFAALIHSSTKLFSKIVQNPTLEYLKTILVCESSSYWKEHYLFAHVSPMTNRKLGAQSINGLIINTIVPFLFCFAHQKKNEALKDRALELLDQMPAEKNAIITGWQKIGLVAKSAYDTQALLQLKKQYCEDKKCLRCRIGHKVLTIKE